MPGASDMSFLPPLCTSHLQGTRPPPQLTGEGIKAERRSILPSPPLQSTLELGLRQSCPISERVLPLACITRPFVEHWPRAHSSVLSATPLFPHRWLCLLMRTQALRVPSRALSKCRAGLAGKLSLTPLPTLPTTTSRAVVQQQRQPPHPPSPGTRRVFTEQVLMQRQPQPRILSPVPSQPVL